MEITKAKVTRFATIIYENSTTSWNNSDKQTKNKINYKQPFPCFLIFKNSNNHKTTHSAILMSSGVILSFHLDFDPHSFLDAKISLPFCRIHRFFSQVSVTLDMKADVHSYTVSTGE